MEQIIEHKTGDYYMDVREFSEKGIELIIKAIRPMQEGLILDSADPDSWRNYAKAHGLPVNPDRTARFKEEGVELTEQEKQVNHDRAVRRARQQIRWLAQKMQADRLLTLTYRAEITDREKVKADFTRFIRLVRKGWKGMEGQPDWRYVAVLELQDRGSYHIHCAVAGWQRISLLRAAWFKAIGGQGNERRECTPGNVDVTTPRNGGRRQWQVQQLSSYISKYLSKTFTSDTSEKRRYWHSKDLKAPPKERYILGAVTLVDAIQEAANLIYFAYGKTINFSRSWVSWGKDLVWISIFEEAKT